MSLNAHMDQSAPLRAVSHKVTILSMVGLCAAVDVAGIRYMAQNWETVSLYVPHVLLAIGVCGIAWRVRRVLSAKD